MNIMMKLSAINGTCRDAWPRFGVLFFHLRSNPPPASSSSSFRTHELPFSPLTHLTLKKQGARTHAFTNDDDNNNGNKIHCRVAESHHTRHFFLSSCSIFCCSRLFVSRSFQGKITQPRAVPRRKHKNTCTNDMNKHFLASSTFFLSFFI